MVTFAFILAALLSSGATAQAPGTTPFSGTVTAADGGDPLGGICVTAWTSKPGSFWRTETNSAGHYALWALPGTYKLEFDVCKGGNYVDEWFDDQPDRAHATEITVAAGETRDADASLATGGRITGTVTDTAGQPLAGACVHARRLDDPFGHFSRTDAAGHYVVEGLATGDYQVLFLHCDAGSYINEYYDDTTDEFSANPVPVTIGQTTSSVDAALAPGATISGRVTGAGGQPMADVCVHASQTEFEFGAPGDGTDANGEYAIEGLPGGTYRVIFLTCGPQPYAQEWWDNQPDWASANPVVASVGQTAGGIDADLSTVPVRPAPAAPPEPPATLPDTAPPAPPATRPDTVAPEATIDAGPKRRTTKRRPRFAFSSGDPSARLECALDAADFAPCTSPRRVTRLKQGRHRFSVIAVDASGNQSPVAKRRFRVSKPAKRGH